MDIKFCDNCDNFMSFCIDEDTKALDLLYGAKVEFTIENITDDSVHYITKPF